MADALTWIREDGKTTHRWRAQSPKWTYVITVYLDVPERSPVEKDDEMHQVVRHFRDTEEGLLYQMLLSTKIGFLDADCVSYAEATACAQRWHDERYYDLHEEWLRWMSGEVEPPTTD